MTRCRNMPQAEKIQEMFDSIAPEYDAFNHITSLGIDRLWRRRALRYVRGPHVLDEACGTGDFSIAIARHLAKNSARVQGNPGPDKEWHWSVTGVDMSEGMLDVMTRKVAEAGLEAASQDEGGLPHDGIRAEAGDCCSLRFADCSFDTVTVAFGVRNFADREKALREAIRVLRPGGRFVMLELGIPGNAIVRAAYKFYFTRIMPLIGGRMSGNKAAYRYLPASVLGFPQKEEWTATMCAAGFTNVTHRALSLGICRLYVGTAPSAGLTTNTP